MFEIDTVTAKYITHLRGELGRVEARRCRAVARAEAAEARNSAQVALREHYQELLRDAEARIAAALSLKKQNYCARTGDEGSGCEGKPCYVEYVETSDLRRALGGTDA